MVILIAALLLSQNYVPDQVAAQMNADKAFVQKIAKQMPYWDADAVGKYEREEIAIVKSDLKSIEEDEILLDYLNDVDKLRDDFYKLSVLDNRLQNEYVL